MPYAPTTPNVKVRFAPSPTGFLHVGNLRTALINWLFAKKYNGHFLLRMDDTDLARSEKQFEEAIIQDLSWLLMPHDSFARQSERGTSYMAAIEKLKKDGRLYPCYETPEELDLKRKTQLNQGRPPLYDRGALKLSSEDRARFEAAGRAPHWRFLLQDGPIMWDDLFRGPVKFQGADLSDPVLLRADGSPVYTLSSVVDDLDFEITHIIRGEDHVANTAVQIQLMEALGGDSKTMTFGHFTWIVDAEGHGLSKRIGSMGVRDLEEAGIAPLAVNSFIARLGTSEPIEPRYSMEALADAFDITTFSRTPPKFSLEELMILNTKWLHHAPLSAVVHALEVALPEAFWEVVKGNITTPHEAVQWWRICTEHLETLPIMHASDKPVMESALKTAPSETLDQAQCTAWCQRIGMDAGVKGQSLWMPLRRALTGHDHGPNLAALMAFMGLERCIERFKIALNVESRGA